MFKENITALKWLFRVSFKNRGLLLLSMFLAVLSGGIGLIVPLGIYMFAIPLLEGESIPEPIWGLPFLMGMAVLLRYVVLYVSTILSHIAAFRFHKEMREAIITHLGKLPLGFFTARSSGAIRKVISEDIEKLELFIAHHVPDMARALAVPLFIFILIGQQSLLLMLCVMFPLFCAGLALTAMYKKQQGRMEEFHDNVEAMNSAIVEYIKGMPVVKIYNVTMESYRKLRDSVAKQVAISTSWVQAVSPLYVLFKTGLDASLFFLLPCAILMYTYDIFSLQQWVLAVLLGAALVGPVEQIYTSSSLLASLFEGIRRVNGLITAQPLPEADSPQIPDNTTIEFKNVGFSYDDGDALDAVSMQLKENAFHAFVGESGSGKSTAGQLLLRFWDVTRGAILIGGKDIRDISLEKLMSLISFVFQDTVIIEDSIAANISLGNPNVSREKVIAAAKLAQAHNFIIQLENGYDTIIGPSGVYVSGGEKQRISIARALLKDSPILVLDEATSSNDPENAYNISQAVASLAGKKTIILITHRLSSAVHADTIFVFSQGKLIGNGTHETLLKSTPEYQRLWKNVDSDIAWELAAKKELNHVHAH